ncbi:MAG: extracellular solute-binding protein [Chloroherpetonaceae bacterium]|nr:extracellular solute-binding protein [Chloroherpetonaceae bacterium]
MLYACNPKENAKRKIVVYSPHGKEMLSEIEKRFEAENPTIDVVWLDMGSQAAFDRIRSEKQRPQADVWWGGPKELFQMAEKESLLEPYEPAWSNEISLPDRSEKFAWMPTFITPECIMFNQNLISSTEVPKEWDELLNPKWKGKIIIRDPIQSGTMRIIFSLMIQKEMDRTGSLDSGYYWLERLHKNTRGYAADPTQMYLKISRGEAPLTLWNVTDALLQYQQNKLPFGFVIPESGTAFAIEGIALVKGSNNLNDAKKFYDYVTSDSSLVLQMEKFYRIPSRKINNQNVPWLTKLNYKRMPIKHEVTAEEQKIWMEHWQSVIRNKVD